MFSAITDMKNTIDNFRESVQNAIDAAAQPPRPVFDLLPAIDFIKLPPFISTKPEFESSYKGLIDGINDLSGQIDAKKAELSNPDLDPSKRMELSIEMQELMQMRLQMITITTNLLKTDHDSAQAVNNNLRA